MARKSVKTVDESSLTKMQIRKLNMLKKSVGDEIGTKAFVNWMSSRPVDKKVSVDKNAVRSSLR